MRGRNAGALLGVLAIAAMSLFTPPVHAFTMSWDPVTTYTDNSVISGSALPVAYDAWWSTTSTFASPHTLLSNGTVLSVSFDVGTQGMARGTTIYFGARARTAVSETSYDSPPFSWTVPSLLLTGLSISSGPTTVNESSTATYTATATYEDGSTRAVTASWSVSPATYCSISGGGVLTASSLLADQSVVINASYTENGVTKTATKSVTLKNSNRPSAPRGLRIGN